MTVKGTVTSIIFRNDDNGYTIAEVAVSSREEITVVGIMPFLSEGEIAGFTGEMYTHQQYGEQLKVTSYELIVPEKTSDIEKYLASGIIKGIGAATAKLIVRHFGKDTFDILDASPERLAEVPGIGPKRAATIGNAYAQSLGMRTSMMFLQKLGLTLKMANKIISRYGNATQNAIKENPYRLCDDIDGIGFQRADAIAFSLGFEKESTFRLNAGIIYVLNEASNGDGHVFLPYETLIKKAVEVLETPQEHVENTLKNLILTRRLINENYDGVTAVYLPKFHKAEKETAKGIVKLLAEFNRGISEDEIDDAIADYETKESVQLASQQREAVKKSALSGVSVTTGGPGTGKTTSIRCLLSILSKSGKVLLCAPTGRAAKRMTEATGMEAKTIHRLLEYSGEEGSFARNQDCPIDANAVIVDEMSMVDIFLMRALVLALKPGTQLILVGDADQLPSVGAGNVLKDIINSGVVSVTMLTEVFRQAQQSNIIMNAHRINKGEYPVILNRDTDFFMLKKETANTTTEAVLSLVRKRLPEYLGIDGLKDIQVMAPMKKGGAGVYELNRLMQADLNPEAKGKRELKHGDTVFRVGDKVMQIKNDYELKWQRDGEEGEGVFNGDIGYITKVDNSEGELAVRFDDGKRCVYSSGDIDELELAYCMSIHKSQGSEFEAVVIPLLSGPMMLMTRNLLYTAVTRAKRLVVIAGREDCVRTMIDNNRIMDRYSALAQKLILYA